MQRRFVPMFFEKSFLVESASSDGKKAPDDLAFYKPLIDVVRDASGNKQDIYGSDWTVFESADDYENIQRIVMEYSKIKCDVLFGNFTRSMPSAFQLGRSSKVAATLVVASNKIACQPSDLDWLTGYLWRPP